METASGSGSAWMTEIVWHSEFAFRSGSTKHLGIAFVSASEYSIDFEMALQSRRRSGSASERVFGYH